MPLVSYFLVAGCFLGGVLYLNDRVLPQSTSRLVSGDINILVAAISPTCRPENDWTPAPAPDMSSPAVLAAEAREAELRPIQQADAEPQQPAAARPRQKKRHHHVVRGRNWQDDFVQDAFARPPQWQRELVRRRSWRDDYAQGDSWSWDSGPMPQNWQGTRFR